MATTFHLVRHAAHATVDEILVGRMAGVALDAAGCDQAERLAGWLCRSPVTAVQSSPRRRAMQTAAPIARAAGVPLDVAPPLDEVDFGDWTGRRFRDLDRDPMWQDWNARRGTARTPSGASMADAQARIVKHLDRLAAEHCGATIVLVSHAEIIRAAVLHCLDLPLNDFARIEIRPASVTTVAIGAEGTRIVTMNEAIAA